MRILLRAGFLGLILLGLASQAIRAGRGDDSATARPALVAALDGLGMAAVPVPGTTPLLEVRSARCAEPFAAGLLRIDGSQDGTAAMLEQPGVVTRYVYLGVVGPSPSPTGLLLRESVGTLLFQAGLRPRKPSGYITVVAYPASCTALDTVDWSVLSPG